MVLNLVAKIKLIWIVSCSFRIDVILLLMFVAEKVLLLLVISLTAYWTLGVQWSHKLNCVLFSRTHTSRSYNLAMFLEYCHMSNKRWCNIYRCKWKVVENFSFVRPPCVLHGFSQMYLIFTVSFTHDDVIKWKHFPCYWPFVRGIHRGHKASDAELWCFLWSAPK